MKGFPRKMPLLPKSLRKMRRRYPNSARRLELAEILRYQSGEVSSLSLPDLLMSAEAQQIDPDFLVNAYASGVFPMAMEDGEIGWFAPDPRGIIPLDDFHVPHGMKKIIETPPFEIRINTDFEGVMRGCADRSETWINDSIIATYVELHRRGCGHSVEAWEGDQLVGGLYGVSLGAAFFGESMFSRISCGSQFALIDLVDYLTQKHFQMIDCQMTTNHLLRFGAREINGSEFHKLLKLHTCDISPQEHWYSNEKISK